MGADLTRLDKKNALGGFEVSERAVNSGYFRDSYNSSSILEKYGLSWWTDIIPLCEKTNEGSVLTPEGLKKFRLLLDEHKWKFEDRLQFMKDEYKEGFKEHSDLLIKYLDDAIADNATVYASL